MAATVLTFKNYRFYFFSREEKRKHVHVSCENGEAKFWLEPKLKLATNYNLSTKQLRELELYIRNKQDEIIKKWKQHFGD